jgi:hypothetical protein
VLHVEVSRIAGDRLRLGDVISYLTSEACPAVERQPGSLGISLLIAAQGGALGLESFWASHGALAAGENMVEASVREAARRAQGAVTRERYQVLVFEREAPLGGGQGVRVTPVSIEPVKAEDAIAPMSAKSSRRSNIEDAVAWYADTAVPSLADTSGFCAALLYADWAAGRLISETVWQDLDALAASRRSATAGEAAAAEAINGVPGASTEYQLVFSSARPA